MFDMVALWTLGAIQLEFERQGGSGRLTTSEMVSTRIASVLVYR